ncbi:MAG: NYN domain-containing protein [Patescibacteria group bacterium]|nr:NYN domain-containing protein [Patescibacteria group bacterium]
MSKFAEQRIGVLVDIQNMYYSARVLHKKKTNFKEILKEAVAGRKLIRAIGYGIKTEEETEKKFFESLEKAGYEVMTKDLQIFKGGMKKGDWDVGIAIDAIKLANNLDVIVLVSGDGDYIPLVKYLQFNKGVRVEIMAFKESCSHKLAEEADGFVNLSESAKFLMKR